MLADEKEKYDPTGFRDAIIQGLEKCSNDLEAISKYLDGAGNKLDYRRYGECLFDILIAGGLLVPGGTLSQDGEGPFRTEACIFATPNDINLELMKNWEQVNALDALSRFSRRFSTILKRIFISNAVILFFNNYLLF